MTTPQKDRGLESQLCKRVFCGAVGVLLISCETAKTASDNANKGNPASSQSVYSTPNHSQPTSINISQISPENSTLDTRQINSSADTNQLTVNQLRTYADRCSPNATLPPPKDLDCSELNLRVKRLFRSNDKITDALILLDRLGRNDSVDNALEDLEDGLPGNSLNSQAIAGGLLDPPPPAPPPDVEENLEDFLNQNGLAINAGAIIQNSQ